MSRASASLVLVPLLALASLTPLRGTGDDRPEAAVRAAAERGEAGAQLELARRLYDGDGVPPDEVAAATWLRRAAAAGDAGAQTELGVRLRHGDGIRADETEAAVWLRKAAEQGDIGGQYWLADSYQWGRGVRQDLAEAVKWLRRAADQGDPGAQCSLGEMYAGAMSWEHRGRRELPRDDAEAVRLFRLAAEQGYAAAEYSLGEMIAAGRGVPRSEAEALVWYRRAAEQGFTVAQSALGEAYEHGRGERRDPVCAYLWYSLAARDGFSIAEGQRDLLAARLTAPQLAEGRRLVSASDPRAEPPQRPFCAGEPMSISVQNGDLASVLGVFRHVSGLDLVGAEDAIAAGKPVKLELEETPWEILLTEVLKAQGYRWVREGDAIRIVPAAKAAP